MTGSALAAPGPRGSRTRHLHRPFLSKTIFARYLHCEPCQKACKEQRKRHNTVSTQIDTADLTNLMPTFDKTRPRVRHRSQAWSAWRTGWTIQGSSRPRRAGRHAARADQGARLGQAGAVGSWSNSDCGTEEFFARRLSSFFEPCSISMLSRANCLTNTAICFRSGGGSGSVKLPPGNGFSLSCGRPVTPVAIRGCLSSSSLPPSFARGRRTTGFYSAGVRTTGPVCAPGADAPAPRA